mmetsp:Transcript_24164/g.72163  ORF Transcript_24164/g.72163 Transcript_24164/m.72163 type:complete len:205 (+) Transcript_24164:1-615(+)
MEARLARKRRRRTLRPARPPLLVKTRPRPRRGAAASKLLETRPRRRRAPLLPIRRRARPMRRRRPRLYNTPRRARGTPATRWPRARVLVAVVGRPLSSPHALQIFERRRRPLPPERRRPAVRRRHRRPAPRRTSASGRRAAAAARCEGRRWPRARRRAALSLYTHRRRGRGLRPGPSIVNRAPRRAECVVKGPRPRRRTSSPLS